MHGTRSNPGRRRERGARPATLTLRDLVGALAELTDDDREVTAAVIDLVRSGRVRLRGDALRSLGREAP